LEIAEFSNEGGFEMRSWSGLLSGAAVVALSMTMSAVAGADPGDPDEPQVVAWVDGYTNFSGPQDQYLSGQGWLVDEEVEFYVNEVYEATATAQPNAEGSATPDYFPVDPLVPGDVVRLVGLGTAENGWTERVRVHEVTSLTVTSVNAGLDRVSGTSEPGSEVLVMAIGATPRTVTADSAGKWSAEFAGVADAGSGVGVIGPRTIGIAAQLDADADPGDVTVVGWGSSGSAPAVPGFGPFPDGWDDGAATDFGFGETSYLSCPEVPEGQDRECPPVEWKYDEKTNPNGTTVQAIITLSDVRYFKEDPSAPGPAYFDVISGIFVNRVQLDRDGDLVSFTATWSWKIQTDTGDVYQSSGKIRDFDDGAAPWDYHRWNGPIIEP
jgi:hypothetical protein